MAIDDPRMERAAQWLFEHFEPGKITHAEAHAEGFTAPSKFRDTWLKLHGDLLPVEVWRIEFDPAQEGSDEG